MIHVYCGDGKGKTSAAIGLAIRAAGAGKKVLFSQFLKDGSSSELKILRGIEQISIVNCKTVSGFYCNMTAEERERAAKDYSEMLEEILSVSDKFDLLILDEVISACNNSIVDERELCRFLQDKPKSLEVVLTGRNPSKELLALADYATEMQKLKHPYDKGVLARLGIEF